MTSSANVMLADMPLKVGRICKNLKKKNAINLKFRNYKKENFRIANLQKDNVCIHRIIKQTHLR